MALAFRTLQRLDRAVALGVLGALLHAVVGMGEARAAVITPPAGDGDSMDGLVRPVGGGLMGCDDPEIGIFAGGALFGQKVIIDFGDDELDFDLYDDDGDLLLEATIEVDAEDVLVLAAVDTMDDDSLAMGALACDYGTRSGGAPFDYTAYDPPFASAPVTLSVGDRVVCEAELDFPFWIASGYLPDPDDPNDTIEERYLWTSAGQGDWDAYQFDGDAFDNAVPQEFLDFLEEFGWLDPDTGDFISPVIDCTTAPAVVAPVSMLALVCEPGVVSPGSVVTCSVSGGDPGIEILWRASASPAFAGAGVRLDAQGRGSFSFRVPASVGAGPVLVELVGWDRTATVTLAGSLVPSRVPAGEGMPVGGVALVGLGLLGVAGWLGRRSVLEG